MDPEKAKEQELLYARLDGKHSAMQENEEKALDFLFTYMTKLAPNGKVAEAFRVAFKNQKLGLNDNKKENQ